MVITAWFHLLFGTLKTTVSACSAPACGNQCGQKRFPPRAGACHRPQAGSVFIVGLTQSHTAAQRRLLPSVYPGAADRHKTFCGTSSRSSGSSPWQNALTSHAPTHRHTLHRQSDGEFLPCGEWRVCVACDNNCGLCSIEITP